MEHVCFCVWLLWLTSVCGVDPCCFKCLVHYVYCCIIFFCVDTAQVFSPFTCWWNYWLFPIWHIFEWISVNISETLNHSDHTKLLLSIIWGIWEKGVSNTTFPVLHHSLYVFSFLRVQEDSPHLLEDPVLKEIAKKHSRNPGQVALRYQLQRGVVVLAKSFNEKRIKENFQVHSRARASGN